MKDGATIGTGVLIAWAWNSFVPDHAMPAEVAAVVGGVLRPLYEVIAAKCQGLVS